MKRILVVVAATAAVVPAALGLLGNESFCLLYTSDAADE